MATGPSDAKRARTESGFSTCVERRNSPAKSMSTPRAGSHRRLVVGACRRCPAEARPASAPTT